MRRARSSCLCRQTRSPACQRPRGSANSPVLTMPSRLRRIRSRNGDAARINSRVEVWRGGLGPYAPPIDNLLSMSLRRDFECVRVIRCRFIFSGKDDELRKGRPAGSIELRVSPSPSKIPYGGFSPVRLQMDRQWRPSTTSRGLSAVHIRLMRPSYTPPQLQLPGIRDPRRDYPFENLSVQCGTTPNN